MAGFLSLQAESPGLLIDQLGSDDETVRAEAAKKLEALGRDAVEELQRAIRYCKPRTSELAQKVLDTIERRLGPETLDRLKSALTRPKTCRFSVQVTVVFRGENPVVHEASADVFFGGPDRVRVDSRVWIDGQKDSQSWICNGTSAWRKSGGDDWTTTEAVPDVREKTAAAALGLSGPDPMPWMNLEFAKIQPGAFRLASPKSPSLREPDPHLNLEFEVNGGDADAYAMAGLLKYDAERFLPLTCEWSKKRGIRKSPDRGRITVTYSKFAFNIDLDEKRFNP
jgi:hypothetical protein